MAYSLTNIAGRCFQWLNDVSNRSAGDYLTEKKQRTLYKSIRNSVMQGNPEEQNKNGVPYNENVGIQMCGDKRQGWNPSPGDPAKPSGKLASASSYQMLLDMAKGKHLVNPLMAGAESVKYGLWLSQMIAINYNGPQNIAGIYGFRSHRLEQIVPVQGLATWGDTPSGYPGLEGSHDLNNQIDFPLPEEPGSGDGCSDAVWNHSAYPGYRLDPYGNVLSPPPCTGRFDAIWWARLSVPTHQDQPAYWRAVNAQPLNGFGTSSWASNITFSDDLVSANDATETGVVVQSFGPAMSVSAKGPFSCLPETGILEHDGTYYSTQTRDWHKVSGSFGQSSTLDAQKYRLPGFQSRCARHQGCIGLHKLN